MRPAPIRRSVSALATLAALLLAAAPAPGAGAQAPSGLPDLVVTSVTTDPDPLVPGEYGQLVVTITNQGDADVAPWFSVAVELTGSPLAGWNVPGLDAGASATLASYTRFSEGDYGAAVVVDADHEVAESDEGNNDLTVSFSVGDPRPDLVTSDLMILPADFGPDDAFPSVLRDGEDRTLIFWVHNIGTRVAGAVDVRITLDGLHFATVTAQPHASDPWSYEPLEVPWTATAGSHEFLLLVDPTGTYAEKSEENNVRTLQVHVIGADDPAPDLAVRAVFASHDVIPGQHYSLLADFENIGAAAAGPFVAGLRTEMGQTSIEMDGLAPGGKFRLRLDGTVPTRGLHLHQGALFYSVSIDDLWAVPEDEERNNFAYGWFQVHAPDLVVAAVAASGPAVAPGETRSVDVVVANIGQTGTESYVPVRVDAWYDEPVVIAVPPLAPGETHTVTVPLTIPYPGDVGVHVRIDDQDHLLELDEWNNFAFETLTFRSDVAIESFHATPWKPHLLSDIEFTVTIPNGGNLVAADYEVRLDIEGEVYGTQVVDRTDVGETTEVRFQWRPADTIGNLPGTYHVRVYVDRWNDLGETERDGQVREMFLHVNALPHL